MTPGSSSGEKMNFDKFAIVNTNFRSGDEKKIS